MSTPPRRRLRAAERRETIVRAAADVFAAWGYERARVPDIARLIAVTEPVIYQNFATKAALFAAVLEHAADQITSQLIAAADDGRDIAAVLRELTSAGRLDELHAPGEFGALFAEALAVHSDQQIHQATQQAVTRVADTLAAIIRRGQAQGAVRADVSPTVVVWLLLSLIRARGFRQVVLADEFESLEPELFHAALVRPSADGNGDGSRRDHLPSG